MKVLVTGAGGQLGRALVATAAPDIELVALERSGLDLADGASIRRVVRDTKPAVVINAAAHTAVDKAEEERELAFAVNATGVGTLAQSCREIGARLVHISTDYVFDGRQARPYQPDDAPNPLNVYGESKLAGEQAVAAVDGLDWLIIRTAWVYARQGRNFVTTMVRLFRERDVVNVVSDQIGTPTSAVSLAQCAWRAAADRGENATLHYTDAGVASWYDFAVAIRDEAHSLGVIQRDVRIVPITAEQYPLPARRPAYTVLDKNATWRRFGIAPVHWRTSLREILKEMAS